MSDTHTNQGNGKDGDGWILNAGAEEQAIIRTAAAQTFALMMQNTAAVQQSLFTILNAMASKALANMAENAPAEAVDKIGGLLGSSASIDQVARILELATKGSLPTDGGSGQPNDGSTPDGPPNHAAEDGHDDKGTDDGGSGSTPPPAKGGRSRK